MRCDSEYIQGRKSAFSLVRGPSPKRQKLNLEASLLKKYCTVHNMFRDMFVSGGQFSVYSFKFTALTTRVCFTICLGISPDLVKIPTPHDMFHNMFVY